MDHLNKTFKNQTSWPTSIMIWWLCIIDCDEVTFKDIQCHVWKNNKCCFEGYRKCGFLNIVGTFGYSSPKPKIQILSKMVWCNVITEFLNTRHLVDNISKIATIDCCLVQPRLSVIVIDFIYQVWHLQYTYMSDSIKEIYESLSKAMLASHYGHKQ